MVASFDMCQIERIAGALWRRCIAVRLARVCGLAPVTDEYVEEIKEAFRQQFEDLLNQERAA